MAVSLSSKDEERFWSFVNKTTACWEWTGALRSGYGAFKVNRGMTGAHQYSFLITKGDLGDLWVLHRCDNRKCVRPDHLFLGTQTDNMVDCANKERIAAGFKNGQAKLTEQIVATIRKRYSEGGVTQQVLADEYGVSQRVISLALSHRTWKHI